jgi:hypothetical protein
VPPGAGQKRAAGPKMARSFSNYVYTHRPHRLHFYRMSERDLNYFVFARYAHLGAARRGAKASSGPKNGPLVLKIRIHASPAFYPFLPHARARSEFICFCSICAPWVPPGAGQKRAAGPKMARSSSNHVYTHCPGFLHICRNRELDLTYFVFAQYAPTGCRPAWGKGGPRGQKWPARPQTTYTRIARIFSISCRKGELDLTYFVFAQYAHPGCRPARGKSGQRAQKWPARPQTTYTRIAGIVSISAACASPI